MKKLRMLFLKFTFYFFISNACIAETNLSPHPKLLGYTVTSDHIINTLDLQNGNVVGKSGKITGLGGLSNITNDLDNGFLYIGSDRSIQGAAFDPLVVVDVNNAKFPVVFRSQVESNSVPMKDQGTVAGMQNAIYLLFIPPHSHKLLLGDAFNPHLPLITILDTDTLKVVGRTPVTISPDYLYSSNGKIAVEMWPAQQRTEYIDGEKKIRQLQGGLAVFETFTGKRLHREKLINNRGLQPPWAKLSSPFIFLPGDKHRLLAYHRDTGKVLSDIDIQELTQCHLAQTYPTLLENPNHIALAMACSQEEGAVVVIDVIEQKLIHKIKVGPFPTNVVVAKH